MSTRIHLYTIIAAALLILVGGEVSIRANVASASSNHVTVKWLQSHQPTDVFARATKVFGETLARESDGTMSLEVVSPQDIGVARGDVPNATVFDELDSGRVQIATTYTVALGQADHNLWALNLPFSFASYDQLPAILDGSVGKGLLAGVASSTDARGLAFTMSGGFRIIATKDKAIHAPADLKGLRIATSGGPVAEATLKRLGATPVPLDLESGNANIDPDTIDGVETTYSRLSQVLSSKSPYLTYINETNHSVFLTAIVANESFYESLTPAQQKALDDAAIAAAGVERQDSIALGDHTRASLSGSGSTIVTLTDSERAAFKAATAPVYAQFSGMFGSSLTKAFTSK